MTNEQNNIHYQVIEVTILF